MKKIISSILFTFIVIAAQATGNQNTSDLQARDISRRLANQIELNELEYIQVKKYTAEKINAVAEIQDLYQTNPILMAQRLDEAEELYANRITLILNARQFNNYQALGKSFRSELNIIAGDYKYVNLLK